jgi:hypothetical protein
MMMKTKVPKRKHTEVRRILKNKIQLTVQVFINKASGQLQHKIWRSGELKKTTIKQGNNASKQQQHNIWDPGRWRITVKTTCNITYDNINIEIKGNKVIEHMIRRS